MITDADIKKLEKTFVTKRDFSHFQDFCIRTFATKVEVQELREEIAEIKRTVNKILITVDKILKKFDEMEYPAFKASVHRHERQIKHIATAVDVDLEE